MNCKIFEIRDRATFIPVVAVQFVPANAQEHYLLRRLGFDLNKHPVVVHVTTPDGSSQNDPIAWGGSTMSYAHYYIEEMWDSLQSGQVIDCEYIRGETDTPKQSEAFEH